MSRVLRHFGKNLRRYRLLAGMTQEDLGAKAELAYKYIGELERGEKNNPSLLVILKLSSALGVDPALLMSVDGENETIDCRASIYRMLCLRDQRTLEKVHEVLRIVFDER